MGVPRSFREVEARAFLSFQEGKIRQLERLHTLTDQKPLEVLGDQPARWRSSEASGEALGAIGRLDFDAEGAQHVDSPAGSGFPILLVLGHGSGNLAIDQPVAALDIVVVTTRANTVDDKGADGLDGGEGASGGGSVCGSHDGRV